MLQGHPGYESGLEISIPAGSLNGEVLVFLGKGMSKKGSKEFGSLRCRVSVTTTEKDKEILQRNAIVLQAMFA